MGSDLAWFGFWIFAAVFVYCDSQVYLQGSESFFQKYKTKEEKEIQALIIQKLRNEARE